MTTGTPACCFGCKGGKKMSFKRTFPYVLTSAAMMFIGAHTSVSNERGSSAETNTIKISDVRTVPEKSAVIDSSVMVADAQKSSLIAINATAQRYDVVYTRADGNQFRRSGGTRAWRNNNPGCLRYSDFTVTQGAIGHAGGFAVFPDEETGMKAICALLKSDKYKNLTISQAIFKYAPPHENDTESYNASLRRITGLPTNTVLKSLNDEQIMRVARAIRSVEGWRPGKETFIQIQALDSLNLYAAVQDKMIQKSLQRTI